MSAPLPLPGEIPPEARTAQARASDPKASAWVSANAGSGKTHVLAQRVLRLLLGGAPPSRILCLTFTKAAAANMAERVFKALAQWTQSSDEDLSKAVVAAGAEAPDAARLAFARRLFARTIETPGGLKIQTIHAFCERLLHLFPFEANVAAGFRVVEEREAALLLQRARMQTLAEALREEDGEQRLAALAREAGPDGFDQLLREALRYRAEIAEALAYWGDAAAYREALAARLGLAPGEDVGALENAMRAGLGGRESWINLAAQLAEGGKKDNDLASALGDACEAEPAAALALYLSVFFTKSGEPRGGAERKIITKPLEARFPGLLTRLQAEQERLIALADKRKAAETLARSHTLVALAAAILSAYARLKGQRGLLDFDDLIERTLALLSRSDAAWVLYKLDSGVDHILVDEAQDTSAPQWEILKRLAEDFTSGKGAREIIRTFFAVGDEKQSIYSFQGAAPKMFAQMRREFAGRHKRAALDFAEVPLHLSFRSAATVLAGVDRTFGVAATWRGMAADEETAPPHVAFRAAVPGLVEVWAPIEGAGEAASDNWLMPVDAPSGQDPAVQLAGRIAQTIRGWLSSDSPERLHHAQAGGRPIAPGDVMILVRSRGAFFEAMIRALKEAGVKAAGADRLALGEHIATMDLIAAGRAALTPDDDLTLACLLKSPLIGLDDDALMALAPSREGSLARALAEASGACFAQARRRLEIWRARARSLSPFAFYARLLGEDGGRRAFLSRLGPEAGDAIDEFLSLALAFEQGAAPSLIAFLDEIEGADVAVKRDMEASGDSVRVMTIHAAKGLEAPIVFLPDTCGAPSGRHDPKLFALTSTRPGEPPLLAWSPREASDPQSVAQARAAAREEAAGEHRRLLYVAMTRAAERLIIAGFHGQRGKARDCWYDMARAGLDVAMKEAPSPWSANECVWRLGEPWRAILRDERADAATRRPSPPAWLSARAAPEHGPTALRPSRVLDAAQSGGFGAARRSRLEAGRLSHALLQYLPGIARDQRRDAAWRFLIRRGAALDEAERHAMLERALAVLDDERLATLFGPHSRAEVAVAGGMPRPGRAPLRFSGRIDRIAVGENVVEIGDFKSGAPRGPTPAPYMAQLALYRAALAPLYAERPLRAFLVWLDGPDVVEIETAALDDALAKLLAPLG